MQNSKSTLCNIFEILYRQLDLKQVKGSEDANFNRQIFLGFLNKGSNILLA